MNTYMLQPVSAIYNVDYMNPFKHHAEVPKNPSNLEHSLCYTGLARQNIDTPIFTRVITMCCPSSAGMYSVLA